MIICADGGLINDIFLIVAEDGSSRNTTENSHQDCSVTAAQVPLPLPTICIEMSEPSEPYNMPSYEPVKLHRVDDPLVRTPKVAGSNTLMIQQDDSITYGSPKVMRKQHAVVGRTLSAGSVSRNWLTLDNYGSVHSVRSSRPSSTDKRSRASSVSERSCLSSGGGRSANCDYLDDFDDFSDVDEGCVSYYM